MNVKKLEEKLGITLSKQQLFERVFEIVQQDGVRYSQAIIDVCEKENIEPEDVAKLITGPLLEKIENESMDLKTVYDTRGNKLKGM